MAYLEERMHGVEHDIKELQKNVQKLMNMMKSIRGQINSLVDCQEIPIARADRHGLAYTKDEEVELCVAFKSFCDAQAFKLMRTPYAIECKVMALMGYKK